MKEKVGVDTKTSSSIRDEAEFSKNRGLVGSRWTAMCAGGQPPKHSPQFSATSLVKLASDRPEELAGVNGLDFCFILITVLFSIQHQTPLYKSTIIFLRINRNT